MPILNFKIKPIIKDKKEPSVKTSSTNPTITGTVGKRDDGSYFVSIINLKDGVSENYPLTEKSFNIYNVKVIYSKDKIKNRYIAIIRNGNDALLHPNYSPFYLPFKPGIKVKGKLIKINGVKYFDLISVCNPESYTY